MFQILAGGNYIRTNSSNKPKERERIMAYSDFYDAKSSLKNTHQMQSSDIVESHFIFELVSSSKFRVSPFEFKKTLTKINLFSACDTKFIQTNHSLPSCFSRNFQPN